MDGFAPTFEFALFLLNRSQFLRLVFETLFQHTLLLFSVADNSEEARTAGTAKRTKLNIGTTSNLKNLWAGRSAVQTVLICSHAKATQNTSASEVPVREEQKKIKEGRREGFETFDQSYQVSQLS